MPVHCNLSTHIAENPADDMPRGAWYSLLVLVLTELALSIPGAFIPFEYSAHPVSTSYLASKDG